MLACRFCYTHLSRVAGYNFNLTITAVAQNRHQSHFPYQQTVVQVSSIVYCHLHQAGTCRYDYRGEYPIQGFSDQPVAHADTSRQYARQFHLRIPTQVVLLVNSILK